MKPVTIPRLYDPAVCAHAFLSRPRHHAITELAESQASDQTIMAIAGHVSPRMLAHYSHVRLEAKRNALDALSRRGLSPTDSVWSEPPK